MEIDPYISKLIKSDDYFSTFHSSIDILSIDLLSIIKTD